MIKIDAEPKVAEATVVVGVNGREYTVKRIAKVVKEPGKPEETKTEVFINGTKASSKAVLEKVLGRLDPKQFLLGFSPMYYDTLSSMNSKNCNFCNNALPTEAEILEQLTPGKEILEQVDIRDSAELKKELSGLEKKKFGLESQAELLKSQVAQLLGKKRLMRPRTLKKTWQRCSKRKELERSLGNPPTLEEINTARLKQQIEQLRKKYSSIKSSI